MSRRTSIVRRLYIVGVVQLLLVAATAIVIGFLARPHPPPPEFFHREMGAYRPRFSPGAPILTLVCGLVVVGLGAIVAARSIVRPLEKLSQTAKAIGRGDLGARAKLGQGDELGELSCAFDEMADRIQSHVLAEKELLANVSHELRTPLARIRVALDLAVEVNAEALRASASDILVDVGELESIIDDIMTAARLDVAQGSGGKARLPLHIERVAPASICAEVQKRFSARHPKAHLELEVDSALRAIEVDAVLVRRTLDNLVENARKYSPKQASITLAARGDATTVEFEVVDHGAGIPDEDLPHVFSPFFRGERSRVRSAGGVGLGLTLAKRIVDAHGGTITIHSKVNEGTRVVVRLPTDFTTIA